MRSVLSLLMSCAVSIAALSGLPAQGQPNEAPPDWRPMNDGIRPGSPTQQQQQRPRPPNADAQRPHAEMLQIRERMREIADRIDRAERRGRLEPREARRLRHELRDVREIEFRMSRDGYVDRREREELTRRVDELHRHLRREMWN